MATTEVWTYQDIVEHLLDVFDSAREGRPLRMARRAAREALRELSSLHRWSYYQTTKVFATEASQTDGTIEYDHTGGAYERMVTLTDSTWPANAAVFRIIIDDVHYPVMTRESDTIITLGYGENPGADVAAGSGYTLYRSAYPLPIDFISLGQLWSLDDERQIPVVTDNEQFAGSIFYYETPDTPWQAAIRNDSEYLNSLSLVFGPPPSTAINYELLYHRLPRQLNTEKYNTGTVTLTVDSTTCTIDGGAFATAHVGCVLRCGTADTEPTNIFGGLDDSDSPAAATHIIMSVSSNGSACTLDRAAAADLAAVKFTISDPVDMEHTSMLTAYQRMSEAAFTKLTKRDIKERQDRDNVAYDAIRLAKERDSRAPFAKSWVYYDPFNRAIITDDD